MAATAEAADAPPGRIGRARSASIGVVGGALAGLLGVGGGTAMVPLLVLWAGVTQRRAHALSLGAIVPISIAGIVVYAAADRIDPVLALGLAIGAIAGARLGVGMLATLSEGTLKLAFGSFLVAVAATMVVTA